MKVPTIDNIPILLPSHNDVEFDPTQTIKHFHVDPRFGPRDVIEDVGQQIIWRERKIINCQAIGTNGIPLYLRLLQLHEGGKLTSCGTCPHKGLKLNSIGRCMGHGLRFDSEGNVLGNLKTCRTRIKSTGDIGALDSIRVKTEGIVEYIELVLDNIILTETKISITPVYPGDILRFTWKINNVIIKV